MAFTPISAVYLLNTPLDIENKNQIYFENVSTQYSYFKTRIRHTCENITYIRKDNKIRIDKQIDSLWDVNYVMYQNGNFANKWFYAYITKMEYVSDSVTEIYIETDVFQSWLFEITIKPSFVVREHVKNDTIGVNMVDEQLETGEYITEERVKVDKMGPNWNILAVSDNSPLGNNERIGNLYGSVATGLTYYPYTNDSTGVEWLKNTIEKYDIAGKPEAIEFIFTVPQLAIKNTILNLNWKFGDPITSNTIYGSELFTLTTKPNMLDGYTPKNNKMFTYPFCFLYISNSVGQSANFNYEYFEKNELNFWIIASPQPNLTVMLVPVGYKNTGANYEYALPLQGFPLCSWSSDVFTAWFSQNMASNMVTFAGSTVATLGGIATANPLMAIGGVVGVTSQIAQLGKAQVQPDQARGQSGCGNIRFATGSLDYYYSKQTIRQEFAKRIDDFFSMYGYKVNVLKVPELHSRTNWNFIKTIDINIDGAIPSFDMVKLKKLFDDGITLWHNANTFLNYSLSNNIR